MTDRKELLEGLRKVTKSGPENAVAWYNLGFEYVYLYRYEEAIEAFRQALRINPEDPDARYCLGSAYRKLGRSDDDIAARMKGQELRKGVIKGLRKVTKDEPDNACRLARPRDSLRQAHPPR